MRVEARAVLLPWKKSGVRGTQHLTPRLRGITDKSLFSLQATAGPTQGGPHATASATCCGRPEGWARWGLLGWVSHWLYP